MKVTTIKTEEKILLAAKEIFMQYGLYGARMHDIAEKAGINKALLHYYYRSKDKLFDAVFEGALKSYFEQMTIFSQVDIPIKERLFIYVDNMYDFLNEYPQMNIFIIKAVSTNQELFFEKVKKLKPIKGSSMIAALNKAFDDGELEPFDPLVFLINILSLLSYPFVASSMIKTISEKSGFEYNQKVKEDLKQSVKDFITNKLISPVR